MAIASRASANVISPWHTMYFWFRPDHVFSSSPAGDVILLWTEISWITRMPTEFEGDEVVFLVAAKLLVLVVVLIDLLALERVGVGRRWPDSMGPTLNANCLLDIFLGDCGIVHTRRQLCVG